MTRPSNWAAIQRRDATVADREVAHTRAMEITLRRWPWRAIEAGTAAKLARRFAYLYADPSRWKER